MLDHFTIFTKSGLVLWSRDFDPSIASNNPISALISESFIDSPSSIAQWDRDSYTVRWVQANDLELVFALVYQRLLDSRVSYAEELLEDVRGQFIAHFATALKALLRSTSPGVISSSSSNAAAFSPDVRAKFAAGLPEWDSTFTRTLRSYEKASLLNKRRGPSGPSTPLTERLALSNGLATDVDSDIASSGPATPVGNDTSGADVSKNVESLRNRLKGAVGKKKGKKGKNSSSDVGTPGGGSGTESPGSKKGKPVKEMRKWDGTAHVADASALDFSGTNGKEANGADVGEWVNPESLGKKTDEGVYEVADVSSKRDQDGEEDEEDEEDDDVGEDSEKSKSGFLSRFVSAAGTGTGGGGFLSSFTSSGPLTSADLTPALRTMQTHLQSKNVAADVSARVCASVERDLVGQRVGRGYGSVGKAVRAALEVAVTRILTPRTSTDILLEVRTKQQRFAALRASSASLPAGAAATLGATDPYAIAFVGVNGVGKSTNLAKVAFWLLQNNLSVLIAACDTFRSGAVEQLRVHVNNLSTLQANAGTNANARIELFEKGYGKDAAGIAKSALTHAGTEGFDVVLIDTAGRMQDNEPLMRALAKLVAVNKPDKCLFVGEALVGNEAVDQLTKFDRAIKDFSGVAKPRGLDGMILTKFDTIDDKVGTCLTATSVTGLPIYFVGVGQTYTDLRQLRVRHVVDALMRD